MSIDKNIRELETILKELSFYEKKGLDTSSLHLFIRNLKLFNKIQEKRDKKTGSDTSFEEKLQIIKSFLEDKKAFPRIKDIIEFANKDLSLEFKDQKESRLMTIQRIIGRIERNPELKEKVKLSVQNIRNQNVHSNNSYKSKKDIENIESFTKWADILSKL